MFINEAKIIYEQLMLLYNNQRNIENIEIIIHPSYNDKNKSFGENIKINLNDYENSFFLTTQKAKINILFNDGSIMIFNYVFDGNGFVLEHHLSFFPVPKEGEDICEIISHHIRLDHEKKGFRAKTHSLTHLHSGNNSVYRFSVENIVYPIDFLYYILLSNYNYDCKFLLDNLQESRFTMQDEEYGSFSLHIIKKQENS